MKKRRNKLVWFLLLILVVAGLYGCGFLDGAIEEGKEIFEDVTSVPDNDESEDSDSEDSVSEDLQKLYEKMEEAYNKDKDTTSEDEESSGDEESSEDSSDDSSDDSSALDVVANLNFHDLDGKGKNYVFTYNGTEFTAIYTKDNWKVIDSYLIESEEDITAICEVLIAEHPIHGKDMESYRTAEDMAYEWLQHNLAYTFLPDGNRWKVKAKDVDLNPADQGLSFDEIYERQTGKKLTIDEILSHIQ